MMAVVFADPMSSPATRSFRSSWEAGDHLVTETEVELGARDWRAREILPRRDQYLRQTLERDVRHASARGNAHEIAARRSSAAARDALRSRVRTASAARARTSPRKRRSAVSRARCTGTVHRRALGSIGSARPSASYARNPFAAGTSATGRCSVDVTTSVPGKRREIRTSRTCGCRATRAASGVDDLPDRRSGIDVQPCDASRRAASTVRPRISTRRTRKNAMRRRTAAPTTGR